MKINKIGVEQVANAGAANSRSKQDSKKVEQKASIQVSGLVKTLKAMMEEVTSPELEARLAHLAELIQSGRYYIDADKLAQSILEALEGGGELNER